MKIPWPVIILACLFTVIMGTLYVIQERNKPGPPPLGMYNEQKMSEPLDTLADNGTAPDILTHFLLGFLPSAYGYAYELPTNEPLNGTVTIFIDLQEPEKDRLSKHCNSESCNIRYMTHSIYSMLTHYANYEKDVIVRLLDTKTNYTMFNGTIEELEPPVEHPIGLELADREFP